MSKEIITPLTGYCRQSAGTGKGKEVLHFLHPTKEDKMWGKNIPVDVDAERYIEGYVKLLNDTSIKPIAESGIAEIIPVARNKNKQITGSEKVANFDVYPIRKVCYIDRYGVNVADKERIECRVLFDGGKEELMEIRTADIAKIAKKITDKFSTAIINFAEPNAEKIIEANFRFRTNNVPTSKRLFEAGWQMVNGAYQYVHDFSMLPMGFEVETGLFLPFYNNILQRDISNIFIRAARLIKETSTAYTIFLFSLMGVLFKVFEDAGHTPHFLLFINGKTGSMKTTIAQILFTQLADMKHRNMPRRIDADTLNSFERAVVLSGRDTTLLIDDYAPAKTPQKKADMQNRLEMIVRMVGDGATKSRSNAKLEDIQGEGVKGMVVVTGEIQGKGVSSNLRCLYCTMKRSYANVENVTWFQMRENMYAYTSAIMHFAEYISQNWSALVDYIIVHFPMERKELLHYVREKRLIDSSACLRITADIFEKFMVEYCDVDKFFIAEMIKEMRNAVAVNAGMNESMSKQETHAQTFIKGIHTLMITNKIKIYSGKMEAEHVKLYDGFEDAEYYYFIPEIVYGKVVDFLGHMRQYMPFDLKELVTSMHEDGIIKTHSNGNGKRTYYARIAFKDGVKQKFLKISKKIFVDIVEGKFDGGEEGENWDE